ncbi:ankyrin repeat domain-containing protein [Legionella worsleiensis]|uniref:Ankyrin repeat-containing protein n=1 Tax=Legionella worsleiensis TaxID=45076 RepID=A0A0W1AK13_9GAMM|nr:ankyrin repeat domain-containing protein [Legionella worsleiensis]KTD81685.1 ankyrin repeat-containing protein [Legionella worsleiensis]STY31905.1 ankyrin repeat-containing protein [Legionella worsleiensis]
MLLVFYLLLRMQLTFLTKIIALLLHPEDERSSKSHHSKSLSHNDLAALLLKLLRRDYAGVCYGFTLNWALAVAEGNEALFYRKLHLLGLHHFDLPQVLDRIAHKKRIGDSISEEELLISSLPELCLKISKAQDPESYIIDYGKRVKQPDVDAIINRIRGKHSTVKRVFYKTCAFNGRQEMMDYITRLVHCGLSENTAVLINTIGHSMGFKRLGRRWQFMDINQLYEQDTQNPYFELDTCQLVDEFFQASSQYLTGNRVAFSLDFIGSDSSSGLTVQLSTSVPPLFPFRHKWSFEQRVYFLGLAVFQGDMYAVHQCLRLKWPVLAKKYLTSNCPIAIALQLNRYNIFKMMLPLIAHRINTVIACNKVTLLHLACEYSGFAIMEDLLRIKGIAINSVDSKGRTPLMYACRASNTTYYHAVFRLLLAHGASVTLRDRKGLNALDHAYKNNHHLAIKLLEKKTNTRALSLCAPIQKPSSVSQSEVYFFKKNAVNPVSMHYSGNQDEIQSSVSMQHT